MTTDEWVQLYVNRFQSIESCQSLLTDQDKKDIVQKGLSDFLSDYAHTQQFIDSLR